MSRARHPRGAVLRALTPIVRRLHLQEIPRLRRAAACAARLAAENEDLQERLWRAEDCAESWRDDVMRMMEDGLEVGLTKSGHVVALTQKSEVPHG